MYPSQALLNKHTHTHTLSLRPSTEAHTAAPKLSAGSRLTYGWPGSVARTKNQNSRQSSQIAACTRRLNLTPLLAERASCRRPNAKLAPRPVRRASLAMERAHAHALAPTDTQALLERAGSPCLVIGGRSVKRRVQTIKQEVRAAPKTPTTRMRLLLLVSSWAALLGGLPVGCEPISDSQQLYCGQCAAECQQFLASEGAGHQRRGPSEGGPLKRATDCQKWSLGSDATTFTTTTTASAGEARNNGGSINDGHQEAHLSELTALSRLECSCRTVFDLKRRALVCRNTSSAGLLATRKRDGQRPRESRLGVKATATAISRSAIGSLQPGVASNGR